MNLPTFVKVDWSVRASLSKVDWSKLLRRAIDAPYIPPIKSKTDTSNFDDYEDDSGAEYARYNDKRANLFPGFG